VPAFAIGRRLGGVAGGLAAAVVIATSGGSFYLSLEFVKNGVGVTMALTAVWLGLRALATPTRGAIALAVGAAIAAGRDPQDGGGAGGGVARAGDRRRAARALGAGPGAARGGAGGWRAGARGDRSWARWRRRASSPAAISPSCATRSAATRGGRCRRCTCRTRAGATTR
jgi:hypothetical protein